MREMPEREFGFLEFHAYEFAGRLLVPLKELASDFEKVLQDVESKGLLREQLSEGHLGYLCSPLSVQFSPAG